MAVRDAVRLLYSRLLVGLEVKVDEEAKVASEYSTSEHCSSFITRAVSKMRKVIVVRESKMFISLTSSIYD